MLSGGVLFIRADGEDGAAGVGGIVVQQGRVAFPVGAQTAIPQERAEHHVVFQSLALVDGDDPHQVFIAFQPQLLFLVPVGRDAAAVAKPLEQTHHAGMGSAGDLQQFGQVQQIGQTPLAVTESQQSLRDFLAGQPSAKKAHETVLAP